MKWTPLSSSNLEAFDYDADLKVLHVKFHGGRIYSYAGVKDDVADGLKTTSSPGKYFGSKIKGQYKTIA